MNKENTEYLFKNFPNLFRDFNPRSSLMAFGFECGDGWFNIVKELCEDINIYLGTTGGLEESFYVLQVKEKFAMLRFYTTCTDDKIEQLIGEAERKSSITCEYCGAPGEEREGSWIKTLCDNCYKERQKERT